MWKVLDGKRLGRPQGEERKLFTDAIWRVLELRWKEQPSNRPSVEAVLLCLEGARPSSDVVVDGGTDGDCQPGVAERDSSGSDSSMFSPFHLRVSFIHPWDSQHRRLHMVVTNARFHRTTVLLV